MNKLYEVIYREGGWYIARVYVFLGYNEAVRKKIRDAASACGGICQYDPSSMEAIVIFPFEAALYSYIETIEYAQRQAKTNA